MTVSFSGVLSRHLRTDSVANNLFFYLIYFYLIYYLIILQSNFEIPPPPKEDLL